MAQTIKIKRGGIGALASLTGTNAGEIALVTGSAASVGITNFSIAPRVLLANNGTNWAPVGGAVYTGSGVPGNINAKLNGLLYFDTLNNQFYRLDAGGNQVLDVSATVQNSLTAGSGLSGGSFNGSAAVTFRVDTGSAHITEGVADIVGAMLTGNTETNITVTYQDTDNTIDFVVADASDSVKGVVELATTTEAATAASTTLAVTPAGLDAFADARGLLSGSGADNRVAYFNGANALQGSSNLTFDDANLTIGTTGQVRFRDTGLYIHSSVDGQLDAIADTKLNLQSPTVDIGNVGTTTATTVNIGNSNNTATVNIKGNLNVNGTTTTVNSTTVNIDDNIIILNYGGPADSGGIEVTDGPNTGSLLWDGTENWWKGGPKSSEKRIVTFDSNAGGTNNNLQKLDSNSNIVESTITDNGDDISLGGNVAITSGHTFTAPSTVTFSGLTLTDSSAATDEVLFISNAGVVGVIDAAATTDEMVGILGYKSTGGMTFSTILDGGTF